MQPSLSKAPSMQPSTSQAPSSQPAVSILNDGIDQAARVCTGELQGDEALAVALDLHFIVDKFGNSDFDSDAEFTRNLESAAAKTSLILEGEDAACSESYTGPSHTCKYGSLVFHQLRALLLYVDGTANRAYPQNRNIFRRELFNENKIFIADNGWMENNTLKALVTFFKRLPAHLKTEGILYDALFATQTVADAWKCNGVDISGSLHTTNRGFNVFQTQVGAAYEQGFPTDTPDLPPASDSQLVVTRHEVSHQFDRIIYNRASNGDSRLEDMKTMLTEASLGHDDNWLRSNVGDEYFQAAPQEIIASNVGNQYLASTSSQLRLAARRLQSESDEPPPTYQTVAQGVATLTRENKECSRQVTNLGTFSSAQECVNAATENAACSYEIMYSSAYPSWGCRCCKPLDTIQYPVEAVLYTDQDLWDVYQYQNSADPICETGVPASWFLFFVDLVTPPQSSTATFFENEVDFEVKTVDVPITRDTNDRIVSLDVPFCGVVTVTYDDDGIVDSISDNALSCVYTA